MTVHVVDVGVSSILGDRDEQQDRYIISEPKELKSRKEIAVFAIFDGHGGNEAVSYVHANFMKHLDDHFKSSPSSPPSEDPDAAAEAYKLAIQRSLKAVDRDISRDDLSGGATAALVLVDTSRNLLVSADLGDSHVVLATYNEHSGTVGQKDHWDVRTLSKEHAPDLPEEKKRIEDAGGEVNYTTGVARVGGVAMSRALGDMEYKKPRVNRLAGHDLSDIPGVETGVRPGATVTHDLVSNKAHFTTHHLSGQVMVMLASDGVGDAHEAVEDGKAVVEMMDEGRSAKEIAKEVTSSAGEVKDADNCTVVVVILDTERKDRRDSASLDGMEHKRSMSSSRRSRRSSMSSLKEVMSRKGSGSSRRGSMSSLRESLKDLVKS